MFTSNSCPYKGRWMLTGLQLLFTVSFISWQLMTYHTPPRMTSKTCLPSPAWKPFYPPPSLSGDIGSTSVRDPVHFCKICILSPLQRLFSHSMTFSFWIPSFLKIQHFPSLISIFFPRLFVQPSFLQGRNGISLLKANNSICIPNFVSTKLFNLKLVAVYFFSP